MCAGYSITAIGPHMAQGTVVTVQQIILLILQSVKQFGSYSYHVPVRALHNL